MVTYTPDARSKGVRLNKRSKYTPQPTSLIYTIHDLYMT